MNIGFDIDGVLSHPLGLKCMDWLLRQRGLCHHLMGLRILGRFLYRMRKIDKEMKALLNQFVEAGYGIIIVSYMPEQHRHEVERWLSLNSVPFDELRLPFEGEEELAFRIRATKGCDAYIY